MLISYGVCPFGICLRCTLFPAFNKVAGQVTTACFNTECFWLFCHLHLPFKLVKMMRLNLHSLVNYNLTPQKGRRSLSVWWYCDSFHLLCSWYAHFSCSSTEPQGLKGISVGGMSNVWVKSQVQTWPLTICVLTRGKVVCWLSFHFTCLLNPVEQSPTQSLKLRGKHDNQPGMKRNPKLRAAERKFD